MNGKNEKKAGGHIPAGETSAQEVLSFKDALARAQTGQKGYDVEKWLYVPPYYGEYRYILGTVGKKPLVCIGVNPSTAAPEALDPTLKSVQRTALAAGYDSFIMFNLYAQRATDPDNMEKVFNETLHEYNLEAFTYILTRIQPTPDVWAAWGTIVEKRDYLFRCVSDMAKIAARCGARWFTCGPRSKSGHPHHPLYLKTGSPLDVFDVDAYCKAFCLKKRNEQ